MEFLEPGKTEIGSWSVTTSIPVEEEEELIGFTGNALVSFTIPLAAARTNEKTTIVKKAEAAPSQCSDGVGAAAGPEHPEADSGFFCVFVAQGPASPFPFVVPNKTGGGGAGISTAGAVLGVLSSASEEIVGTYAVTG